MLATTILLALLPVSELRGAIPWAVAHGMPLWQAALLAASCNALVGPLAWSFLETAHRGLYRVGAYARLFDHVVTRVRTTIHARVRRWGYLGLLLFVAVPLPMTGVWSGTLGAWVLGLDRTRALLALAGGVAISALLVSLGVGAVTIAVDALPAR
jgi:uncharacterized membrane protein